MLDAVNDLDPSAGSFALTEFLAFTAGVLVATGVAFAAEVVDAFVAAAGPFEKKEVRLFCFNGSEGVLGAIFPVAAEEKVCGFRNDDERRVGTCLVWPLDFTYNFFP